MRGVAILLSGIIAVAIAGAGCNLMDKPGADPASGDPASGTALSGDVRRTVIFMFGPTQPGQDMFIRGGLDHDKAEQLLGRDCTAANLACAMPIAHRNAQNATTQPWKMNEEYLDWYGAEAQQTGTSHGIAAQGTPADWTTDVWDPSWGPTRTVAVDGFGVEPLNGFGPHYWMVDVDMDCSAGFTDGTTKWFELKSFISNGPGWESDVHQQGTPYASANHFAQCGMINVFRRNESSADTFPFGPRVVIAPPITPTNDTTPTINFTVTGGGGTLTCQVDALAQEPCTTPTSFTPTLANGTHTITVRATDTAGNAASANTSIMVDTTLPPEVTLVGAGDIAGGGPGASITAALIQQIPGTVFTLGDNAYDSGSANEFTTRFNPTWGAFKSRIRFPTSGNHDYVTSNASGYFGYFGAAAGPPSKGYYSADLGAWHIIVVNSNCSAIGGCGVGSPQEQFIRADLAAHPTACTLAMWHHPLFNIGIHGSSGEMKPIFQALYDGGADVVLTGHEHNYQRWAPLTPNGAPDAARGIREFVVGTGGIGFYNFSSSNTNVQAANNQTFGVLKLTLRPTSYSWEFIHQPGATFTDSGTTNCH